MDYYFSTQDMKVGYQGNVLIHDISLDVRKGEIVVLIGPNGSGKSTILKTITRQLAMLGGKVLVQDQDVHEMSYHDLAKKMAVVLTERMNPELLTCYDVVATGRYPYTGRLGILGRVDEEKVRAAMKMVSAEELAGRNFTSISDGQRQRVLLARAICQEPDIIVLDEPTSYLDIRHKLELLSMLRKMAKEQQITIIMSLHEIELAQKIADQIVAVKGEEIFRYGKPEDVFEKEIIRELYEIDNGSYDPDFGSVELARVDGAPEVFVIAGAGTGIPVYRKLQKEGIPFATGIIYENDIDYRVAEKLAVKVVAERPFCEISDAHFEEAVAIMKSCKRVIVTDVPVGDCNQKLKKLKELGLAQMR